MAGRRRHKDNGRNDDPHPGRAGHPLLSRPYLGNMPDPAPAQLDAAAASRLRRTSSCRLQYRRRGRWVDPAFAKRIYLILSLVAKSALAWQVYAGALAGG